MSSLLELAEVALSFERQVNEKENEARSAINKREEIIVVDDTEIQSPNSPPKKKRKRRFTVLEELLEQGYLQEGCSLVLVWKGKTYKGTLGRDAYVHTDDWKYNTLDHWLRSVNDHVYTSYNAWRLVKLDGVTPLRDIKTKYYQDYK